MNMRLSDIQRCFPSALAKWTLALAAVTGTAATTLAAEHAPYLALVRQYADTMIERGRDHYGSEHSPLFASALDRRALSLLTNSPPAPEGIRAGDRTLTGANPMHDENFLRVLYLLTELTDEPRYAREADNSLRYFFDHCQSPVSGLLAWGEHLGWDFQTDTVAKGRDIHEFYRPWALWDRSWVLSPGTCRRFALGLWENQIQDHNTGNFSRHASYAKRKAARDNEFPRHAGFYIATWAEAYAHTKDTNLLHAIEVLLNSFERRRHADGSFPSASSHPDIVWWTSDLSWAVDVWAAAGKVPEPLATRMFQAASKTDLAYLSHSAKGLSTAPAQMWVIGYGNTTTSAEAMTCHERWRQTQNEGYRRLVLGAADAYLTSPPPANVVLYPGVFGDAISLLVTAAQITSEARYLSRADALAETAVRLFWSDGPLPRAATSLDHYEAITRADTLAMALLQLSSARGRTEKTQRILEWIDR